MRFLIMSPPAFLLMLERAHEGEEPDDLMFESLDSAMENQVKITMEVPEDDA